MRVLRFGTHALLALVMFGPLACGNEITDPSTPTTSDILATVPLHSYGAGSAELLTAVRFSLSMSPGAADTGLAPHYALFDQTLIRDGDEGTTLIAKADNDPDFAAFTALLTDGFDERITVSVLGGSTVTNESMFFARARAVPDFAGYTIDSIAFRIDSVLIVSPGRNPNRDSLWTDYDLGGQVVVVGHQNGGTKP